MLKMIIKFNLNGDLIKNYMNDDKAVIDYTLGLFDFFFNHFEKNYSVIIDYIIDSNPNNINNFQQQIGIEPSIISVNFIKSVVTNKKFTVGNRKEITSALLFADLFSEFDADKLTKYQKEIFEYLLKIIEENIENMKPNRFEEFKLFFQIANHESSKDDIINIVITLFKMGLIQQGLFKDVSTEIITKIEQLITRKSNGI